MVKHNFRPKKAVKATTSEKCNEICSRLWKPPPHFVLVLILFVTSVSAGFFYISLKQLQSISSIQLHDWCSIGLACNKAQRAVNCRAARLVSLWWAHNLRVHRARTLTDSRDCSIHISLHNGVDRIAIKRIHTFLLSPLRILTPHSLNEIQTVALLHW